MAEAGLEYEQSARRVALLRGPVSLILTECRSSLKDDRLIAIYIGDRTADSKP